MHEHRLRALAGRSAIACSPGQQAAGVPASDECMSAPGRRDGARAPAAAGRDRAARAARATRASACCVRTVPTRQPDYDQVAQWKKSLDGDRPAHSFSQSFSMTVWLINFDYYVDYYVDLLAHMYYGKSSV